VKTKTGWQDYLKGIILSLNPNLDTEYGAINDLVINPFSTILSEVDSEIERLKAILDLDNYSLMTDSEFNGLLSNYLFKLLSGERARGYVYFQAYDIISDITIPRGFPVATQNDFGSRLVFYTIEEKTIPVDQKSLYFNPSEGVYEVAVQVECFSVGSIGRVPSGVISVMMRSLTGIDKVINKEAFSGGLDIETREDAVRRIKLFLNSVGRTNLKSGLLLNALRFVDDASVFTYEDTGYSRGDVGGVDLFVIGEDIRTGRDYFRVGYYYIEDISKNIVKYFDRSPVKEIVKVQLGSDDKTSWFSVKKDVGVYSGSIRGRDALYIDDPSHLDGYFGQSGYVDYKYNYGIKYLQDKLDSADYKSFGVDLLVREASIVYVYIKFTLYVLSGFDKLSVSDIVRSRVLDYVNTLNLGYNLEMADLIYVVRGVAGVDNVVFSDFRTTSESSGTVHDIKINKSQYIRISEEDLVIL